MNWTTLGLALAALFVAAPAAADIKDVPLGLPLAQFDKLVPGKRLYIRYKEKDGVASPIDLQTKEVRFEEHDGKPRLRILQRWEGAGTWREIDSLFERSTFRPLTHQRNTFRDGKLEREGFRFLADKVAGIADQPDNVRKDFEVATPEPAFNFETDLETLQALPLETGAAFRIVFYHAGGAAPAPYVFKVVGEEKLPNGVDCWIVTTDYNDPKGPAGRFLIAKASQVVMRVESTLPDGTRFVKALVS